jgi:hypothetical protein
MHLFLALLLAQTLAPADASKLALASPRTAVVVDMDKIGGEPWRLSWSPDGQQMHLAAMKRKRDNSMDLTHHIVNVGAGTVQKVAEEPAWAAEYWTWKGHKNAPGNPKFAIELDQQRKNESATSRPMGGDLARGGGTGDPGASIDEVAGHGSTNVLVITLLLKGEILGQWKGEPFVPGLTYGWAPAGAQVIAFAHRDGRLMLMDEEGRKQRIEGTKDVRLPAWSTDGKRLAWLEKQDRKKFRVQVADVS